jgi:hypothetical protein
VGLRAAKPASDAVAGEPVDDEVELWLEIPRHEDAPAPH